MADINKLAVQDRVKANYKISPNDPDATTARTCIENPPGDPVNVTFSGLIATNAKIYNLSLPTAGDEESLNVSNDSKQFLIRLRGIAELRLATVSGETATNYFTIPKGATLTFDSVDFDSKTLYFRSDKANQTVEIIEFT
jgi:hypothetical protein